MLTTYKDQQDFVLDQLSKSDATTRNRIKTYVNLGYNDFVTRETWPFREKTGTLPTVSGTQEYGLKTNFTDIDEQNIHTVTIQGSTNKKLPYISYDQLRAANPDLDLQGSSVPQKYYLKAGQIGFWPKPNAIYTVAVDYFLLPADMVNDSDEPVVPKMYREALAHYALSLEHDFNTDPDLAQKAMNRYEEIVTLARNNLLAQPQDSGAVTVLGPAHSKYWL